ncbi:hypothetical protein C7S14_2035 [Burkholderia cepacia]|nr:hypothetical protein C7S14_2035 [Burkholderia cepacia]
MPVRRHARLARTAKRRQRVATKVVTRFLHVTGENGRRAGPLG